MADETTPPADGGEGEQQTTPPEGSATDAGQPGGSDDDGKGGKRQILADLASERDKRQAAETALAELQRSQMTDQEKAVDEARAAGRAEALSAAGTEVAKAKFEAVIAGRLEGEALDTFLGGLNLAAFLDADGKVDTYKVKAYVDGVLAAVPTTPIDLGQGARGGGNQIEMDPKKLAERVRPTW